MGFGGRLPGWPCYVALQLVLACSDSLQLLIWANAQSGVMLGWGVKERRQVEVSTLHATDSGSSISIP